MDWKPNKRQKKLCKAFLELKTIEEAANFIRDLLTISEIEEFTKRLKIAQLLEYSDLSYKEIANKLDCSTTTVTRVSRWINHGTGGYKTILPRLK